MDSSPIFADAGRRRVCGHGDGLVSNINIGMVRCNISSGSASRSWFNNNSLVRNCRLLFHKTAIRISRISSSIRRTFRIGSSSSSSGGSGRAPWIYGPETLGLEDDQLQNDAVEDKTGALVPELLAKIESYYQQVKHRRVFDNGFCFGLLDPVSNIVVGVFIALLDVETPPTRRLRGTEDLIGDMNMRSLMGLVAFLTTLFPSLTEAKALWYLNKAELDALVAARLIIKHRGMEPSFGFTSDTTVAAVETALRCAAAAAQHPDPLQFASGWKSISPVLNKVATLLSGPYATFDENICSHMQSILLQGPRPSVFSLEISWDLASSRLAKLSPDPFIENKVQVYPERSTMRRMLLTTIHGYYLQALARLPKDKLLSRYHHSMLQAGHCYGPLDPVSNIILNTIWYSAAFPLTKALEIEAISTRGLLRIAVRSFYGLVSFMCNRWALDADQAIQLLQADGARLALADCNNLLDCGKNAAGIGSATVEEAYTAATIAAQHPVPHLQASLLGPANQPLLWMASDILMPGGMLSREDTDMLQTCLVYSCKVQEQQPREPTMLNKWDYPRIDRMVNNFWTQHHRVVEMVKTALDQMAFDDDDDDAASSICSDEVSKYELHVICGVNERVDGPVYKDKPSTCMYRSSHINFLATRSSGGPPTLFFAEFHGTKVGLCCPVKVPPPGTEQVRCFYCECHGSRIVHPASKSFCGSAFEEILLCGDELYSEWYSNDEIIGHSHQVTYWADHVEDDWIYCSYSLEDDKDEEITEFLHDEILYAKFK